MVVGGGPDVLPRVEPLLPAGAYEVEFVGLDQEPYGCITRRHARPAGGVPADRRRRRRSSSSACCRSIRRPAACRCSPTPPSPKARCCLASTTFRHAASQRGARAAPARRGTDAIVEPAANERRSPPCARAPRPAGARAGRGEDLPLDGDPPAERRRRAHRDRRAAPARLAARLPPVARRSLGGREGPGRALAHQHRRLGSASPTTPASSSWICPSRSRRRIAGFIETLDGAAHRARAVAQSAGWRRAALART